MVWFCSNPLVCVLRLILGAVVVGTALPGTADGALWRTTHTNQAKQNIDEWIKAGFERGEAVRWRAHFCITEAKYWDYLEFSLGEARTLKSENFSPKEAHRWIRSGYGNDKLIRIVSGSFLEQNDGVRNFSELKRWIDIGYEDPSVLYYQMNNLQRKGFAPFTITVAEKWVQAGFSLKEAFNYIEIGYSTPHSARASENLKQERIEKRESNRFWNSIWRSVWKWIKKITTILLILFCLIVFLAVKYGSPNKATKHSEEQKANSSGTRWDSNQTGTGNSERDSSSSQRNQHQRSGNEERMQQGNPEFVRFAYVLGLNINSDPKIKEIKKRWKKLIKQNHPDKFGRKPKNEQNRASEKTKQINMAYEYFKQKYGFS